MEGGKIMKILKFEDLNLLEIGNEFEITGVVYQKPISTISNIMGESLTIMLPDELIEFHGNILFPTLEQWKQIIRQSDLKETEGMDKGKKIILRKSTRQIEQKIMWNVFRRDEFKCRYCAAEDVPMTVDHVVLWEEMGPSIEENLICSCKKCNNARGNMQYEEWLQSDYYLRKSALLSAVVDTANSLVILNIPNIKANHLRNTKRSR